VFEYFAVLVIVGVAAVYAVTKLRGQITGRGCEGCRCAKSHGEAGKLIQIELVDGDRQ